MGLYRYTASGEIVRTADNATIPTDPRNRDRRILQAWLDGGNTPDAAPDPSLEDAQADAIETVNAKAAVLRQALLPAGGVAVELWQSERWREALACDADGSPTSGEYPLLNAEIPETGANLAAVADAVIVERAAVIAGLAAIETVRLTAVTAIDGAADAAAVETILAGLTWPS